MTIKSKRFTKGIITKPTDNVTSEEGEQRTDKTAKEQKVYLDGSERTVVTKDQEQELTNKTIDATAATGTNTLSADAVDITYDDTLDDGTDGTTLGGASNVQSAIDAIKDKLDAQNEASEIGYDATNSGLDTGDANSNVKAAIDDLDDNVDDLITLSGVGENSTDLGTFTNTVVGDNLNIKEALQFLGDKDLSQDGVIAEIDANVDDLITLSGVSENDTNLGNFDGNTIVTSPTPATVKSALQDLENGHENHINATQDVHGIGLGSDVVGTNTTQDLSNKKIISPNQLDVKQSTLADLEEYAAGTGVYVGDGPATNGQLVFATNEKEMFQVIDGELKPVGGGGTFFKVTQNNTFSAGQGIYHNSGTGLFEKASADDANKLAYYVVTEASGTEFTAADFGRVEIPSHGYAVGFYYFLTNDPMNAGDAVSTEPTTGFSNPLFYVEDANTLQIKVYRPSAVSQEINLDDLGDVDTTTTTPNNGDILEYNSGTWTPVAFPAVGEVNTASNLGAGEGIFTTKSGVDLPFKSLVAGSNVSLSSDANTVTINATGGGGGGVGTIIAAGGTMLGTYDGDVILEGNATLTSDVTIKGNLIYTSNNFLSNNDLGYNLSVYGNVFGDGGFIDLSTNTSSVNGGNFTCRGSVYDVNIWTQSGGASSTQPGVSGNVEIQGDYIAPLRNILTHGGDSTTAGVAPGFGGSVTIGGDVECNTIWTYGGTSKGSCDQAGANGGDVTIGGNARVLDTGTIPFTTDNQGILFSGGDSEGAGGNGGNAGDLFVGGNIIFHGGFTGRGGDCTVGSFDGGTGGGIIIRGDLIVPSKASLRGGHGTNNGGDAKQFFTTVLFEGAVRCSTLDFAGGDGGAGNGGKSVQNLTLGSYVYINSQLIISGGDAAAGFTNGAVAEATFIKGGGYIQQITATEGSGGNESTVDSQIRLIEGCYTIGTIWAEDKDNDKISVRGLHSLVSLNSFSIGLNEFSNIDGDLTGPQGTPEDYIYKFGSSSDPVKRSAIFTSIQLP